MITVNTMTENPENDSQRKSESQYYMCSTRASTFSRKFTRDRHFPREAACGHARGVACTQEELRARKRRCAHAKIIRNIHFYIFYLKIYEYIQIEYIINIIVLATETSSYIFEISYEMRVGAFFFGGVLPS